MLLLCHRLRSNSLPGLSHHHSRPVRFVSRRRLVRFVNGARRLLPPTHPAAGGFSVADELRFRAAPRSLPALTKKDVGFAITDGPKRWRRSFLLRPVPAFLPA